MLDNSLDKERVTIILHSGAYDRASYALSLALVALAMGMEVHLLLTFEGLRRFTKGHLADMGEETSQYVTKHIKRGLASGGVQSLEAQLGNARALGMKIYACPNAMATLNIAKDELIDEVDSVMGLAAFWELARTAKAHWLSSRSLALNQAYGHREYVRQNRKASVKKIGILGGMSPLSTLEYYRIITSRCNQSGMGYCYPEIIIYSLNYQEFVSFLDKSDFRGVTNLLLNGIRALRNAGADFALMASNTPHIVFDDLSAQSPIPMLDIVTESGKAAHQLGARKVGLFGTKFTMQGNFYRSTFSRLFGIDVVSPGISDQEIIHDRIMTQLVNGIITDETRSELAKIARVMAQRHEIEVLILGCTELPLILSEDAVGIPVLDTTRIHAEAALKIALSQV